MTDHVVITITVTRAERNQLRTIAQSLGHTLTAYVRSQLDLPFTIGEPLVKVPTTEASRRIWKNPPNGATDDPGI